MTLEADPLQQAIAMIDGGDRQGWHRSMTRIEAIGPAGPSIRKYAFRKALSHALGLCGCLLPGLGVQFSRMIGGKHYGSSSTRQRCPAPSPTILIDNGIQFTSRVYAFHYLFDRVCDENDIEHRLTKVKGLTPYELICKRWTSEPDRFILDPIHQMQELNN